MTTTSEAITRLAREESGRVLALLAHRFGDLDLADESVQDALVQAVTSWAADGIPDNPAAWLYTVAHNRGVDRLRRAAVARRRLREAAPDLVPIEPTEEEPRMIVEHSDVGDEHLRLVLLCCHPALDRDSQVALTLRLVGGLTTQEIAAAFLVPEATLAQRIVRAKRKIRDAGIPLSVPTALDERIDALLRVLYLIFNEGYLSRGADATIRIHLMDEALRLTAQAAQLMPESAEVDGLLALELFSRARAASRLSGGELVLLEDQDRTTWDLPTIAIGNRVLGRALARLRPGPFQLQALIASHHANARAAADTDWAAIAGLYGQLEAVASTPIVTLNRSVAVGMADGPRAGLAMLETVGALEDYYLYWSTRGELLLRSGEREAARDCFARALELAGNPAERRHLERRIAVCAGEA